MSEVNFGMKRTVFSEQSIRPMPKDTLVKMPVVQAMTSMFMFIKELEPISAAKKLVLSNL